MKKRRTAVSLAKRLAGTQTLSILKTVHEHPGKTAMELQVLMCLPSQNLLTASLKNMTAAGYLERNKIPCVNAVGKKISAWAYYSSQRGRGILEQPHGASSCVPRTHKRKIVKEVAALTTATPLIVLQYGNKESVTVTPTDLRMIEAQIKLLREGV